MANEPWPSHRGTLWSSWGWTSRRPWVMGAIQFFAAQIDDQLLPRAYYDDLLARHGFTDPGSASITPMHALTWARRLLP